MKNPKKVMAAAVIVIAATVSDAQAGLIKLQPVTGTLEKFITPPPPPATPVNNVLPGLAGYLNGELVLQGSVGTQYLVEFTLIGSESGFTNQLRTPGGLLVESDPPTFIAPQTVSYIHTASGMPNDFLRFQFESSGLTNGLVNGVNPIGGGTFVRNGGKSLAPTFFVSFCITENTPPWEQWTNACNLGPLLDPALLPATEGDSAWLAFDDGGGTLDDNHDDWVGYIQVSAVPDGGVTAGLLGAALLGLGIVRRRLNT
jgi:hypothetical protein